MKYKVGDKVRVRKDIFLGRSYGNWDFIHDMAPLIGKYVTVTKVLEDSYKIEEYTWRITDEMLEDVEEKFKLPGKWCIKQCRGLMDWGKTTLNRPNKEFDSDKSYYWPVDESLVNWGFGLKGVREEITFDQFKKYVLKSESTPVKEDVKFEVGKWYTYSAEYINHKTYAKYSSNQSVGGRFYYDEIITENNGFKKGHNWSVLTCKPVLLTDLSEIQQYLPESHPDKIKKRIKKVEDLKYPDAVHCSSKEEHYKVKQFANIGDYEGDCYYLLDAKSWRKEPWTGTCASNLESRTTYTNYEFSDIIFPEEKAVDKEDEEFKVGAYIVFIDSYGGSKKGDIEKICRVDSPEQIRLVKEGLCLGRLREGFNKKCKYFLTLKEAQSFSDELLGKNKIETKHKLSKEELLAEAKRRYPVGTKYKNASDDSSNIFVLSSDDWSDSLLDDVVFAEYGKGCLYYKGDWAEIISEPTVEEHPRYVECIGLEEVDVSLWSQNFTVGEIYLVQEDDGTTTFKINRVWCDRSQFKPSTKEAFDKQSKSGVKEKEELVQTEMSQQEACRSCSYYKIVKGSSKRCYKQDSCDATGGQHYPKDYIPGSRTDGYMDGVPVSERLIIHTGNMGLLRGIYNIPVSPEDCFDSYEIYVPIIKTEVKQIKL